MFETRLRKGPRAVSFGECALGRGGAWVFEHLSRPRKRGYIVTKTHTFSRTSGFPGYSYSKLGPHWKSAEIMKILEVDFTTLSSPLRRDCPATRGRAQGTPVKVHVRRERRTFRRAWRRRFTRRRRSLECLRRRRSLALCFHDGDRSDRSAKKSKPRHG